MRKYLTSVLVVITVLSCWSLMASTAFAESLPDVSGMDVYVRENVGQFPARGDVVFVKAGLNPKIGGYVLAPNPKEVVELIGNSVDPSLISIFNKNGEVIGYGWGSFDYNSAFNKVTPPKAGTGGKDGGGDSGGNVGA